MAAAESLLDSLITPFVCPRSRPSSSASGRIALSPLSVWEVLEPGDSGGNGRGDTSGSDDDGATIDAVGVNGAGPCASSDKDGSGGSFAR